MGQFSSTTPTPDLNVPERISEIRRTVQNKPALRKLYLETYLKYKSCLSRCPSEGLAIELGAGGSFVKEVLPEVLVTDVIPYPHLDTVADATNLPFPDKSLRVIFMQNVFHHIPDVEAFFKEAERCLKPGGRIFIADQNYGWISGWILKYLHHEPWHPDASSWKFDSNGPLSDANGALPWIVFRRDLSTFRQLHPFLQIRQFTPHTPLRYWLAGGLKRWSLIPLFFFPFFTWLDKFFIRLSPNFGSFVDIEIELTFS